MFSITKATNKLVITKVYKKDYILYLALAKQISQHQQPAYWAAKILNM